MSGPVRVIVEVQVSRRAVDSEYPLSVAESRSLLVKAMLAAGAKLAEPLGEQPLVLLELTTSQIESLMATGLVRNVHLDDIAKTQ